MSNKLKKFIGENRAALDSETPSDKVWENIEASIAPKKVKESVVRPLFKLGMVAAAMLIIATGIYFIAFKAPDANAEFGTAEPDLNLLAPEYAPQMIQFTELIDMKQEELKVIAKEQPELYRKFTKAINQLDSSYSTLKNQLGTSPNREMLLEAMIRNLQLQLSVLNQQLNIINQIKEQKKYSHEKI